MAGVGESVGNWESFCWVEYALCFAFVLMATNTRYSDIFDCVPIMLSVCDGNIYPQFFNSGSLRWLKFDHLSYMSISGSCTNLQDPTHCSYMIWFLLPLILSWFPFPPVLLSTSGFGLPASRDGVKEMVQHCAKHLDDTEVAQLLDAINSKLDCCVGASNQVDFTLDFWELVDLADFFWDGKTNITLMEYISVLYSFCGAKPVTKMEPEEIGHVFQRLRALSEDVQRLVGLWRRWEGDLLLRISKHVQLQLQLSTSFLCLT